MSPFDKEIFQDVLFRSKKKKKGYRLVAPPVPVLEAPVADTHAHLDLLDAPLALAQSAVHRVSFVCSIVDVHEDAHSAYDENDRWLCEAHARLPELLENTKRVLEEEGAQAEAPFDASLYLPKREALQIPAVRIIAGCHPHNAKHYDEGLERILLQRLRDPRTCAVGEVGLDYHYDFSPRETQREIFRRQIQLAHLSGLPLALHLRDAHDDALAILTKEGFPQAGTLLHCYTLDHETLIPWLEQDCYIAFGGTLTFKNSDDTRAAAAQVPLNRLLTETDAPYMAPEPMRGMPCGPAHTIFTAAKLADIRNATPGNDRETFLTSLYSNAHTLLQREPTAWQRDEH